MKTVDVGAAIDEGRWTGYQKLLIFGTALTIILDGVDNQLLPNAVPTLIEWGRPRGDFIGALSYGPFGMMIGGLIGGIIGDRYGRRTALLGSVLTFAVLTFAIAFANTIEMLGALRFLAGVGLGGAMPSAATLASEYVPAQTAAFRCDADHRLYPAWRCPCRRTRCPDYSDIRVAGAVHRRRSRADRAGGGALEVAP